MKKNNWCELKQLQGANHTGEHSQVPKLQDPWPLHLFSELHDVSMIWLPRQVLQHWTGASGTLALERDCLAWLKPTMRRLLLEPASSQLVWADSLQSHRLVDQSSMLSRSTAGVQQDIGERG